MSGRQFGVFDGPKDTRPPRHAKERNPIWQYIALGGYFAIAGFIGAFLGTLLANIL